MYINVFLFKVYILFRRSVIKRLSTLAKSILCIPQYHGTTTKIRRVAAKQDEGTLPVEACDSASAAKYSMPINDKNSRFDYVLDFNTEDNNSNNSSPWQFILAPCHHLANIFYTVLFESWLVLHFVFQTFFTKYLIFI